MTTRRLHTQTKFIKHGNDMYNPEKRKVLVLKFKHGGLPITCSNLKNVLHMKVKVSINELILTSHNL